MGKAKIIRVFDMDGTTTNTKGANYITTCHAHAFFNKERPLYETFCKTYDQRNGFRNHILGLGIPEDMISEYGKKWCEIYIRMIRENPPPMIPGARAQLEKLKEAGDHIILLTKASPEYVDIQMKLEWAKKVFNSIAFVEPSESKAERLSGIMKRLGEKVIYFGDTVSDGEECKASGAVFGAMMHSYSYNEKDMLESFIKNDYRNSTAVRSVFQFDSSAARFFNGRR